MLGLCGKSNTGKTTFFSASTLIDAEISNRIFTTINPNTGITYVRIPCVCKELGVECNPNNSSCINNERFIPVKIIDVAGLVPGAHEGRGLGNKFLSELMINEVLIHIIDISGSTDKDGNPIEEGTGDVESDIINLEKEIDFWIFGLIKEYKHEIERKLMLGESLEHLIYEKLSGLKISEKVVKDVIDKHRNFLANDNELFLFVSELRKNSKPMLLVANKIDMKSGEENYKSLSKKFDMIPCCADAELALRKAVKNNLIKYLPGDSDFEIIGSLNEHQRNALETIRDLMKKFNGTGVQKAINTSVFELNDMIVVYPVENDTKLSDKEGNVLPDALIMKRGSTALDLAYKIHEEIGKKFIKAIDCKSGMVLSADYILQHNDIISIKTRT